MDGLQERGELMADSEAYQNGRGESGTVEVTPCGDAGAVLVTVDGKTLSADEVLYRLTAVGGEIEAAYDLVLGKSQEAALHNGRPREEIRGEAQYNSRTRRVLRDSAIRILRRDGIDGSGPMSISAIAEYLSTSRGTVQRALLPGAALGTNNLRTWFKRTTGKMPAAPIPEIARMLRQDSEAYQKRRGESGTL